MKKKEETGKTKRKKRKMERRKKRKTGKTKRKKRKME